MRKATNNVTYVTDENEEFFGVSLGYDYCAEHEWGVKGIKRDFGIDSSKIGLPARTITKGKVIYKEDGDVALIRTESYSSLDNATFKEALPNYCYMNTDGKLSTAWDEDSFCIVGEKSKIKELFDAFNNTNIAFATITDGIAFGGTSLCVLIKDKIPASVVENLAYVDNKSLDLAKYEEKIGIAKLKKDKYKSCYDNSYDVNKDKYWMALSPSWINYKNESPENLVKNNTKYDIKYWVNYGDNDVYGWFTVEQIKEWLENPTTRLSKFSNAKA